MSAGYRTVQWSPYKRRYDAAAALIVIVYLATFFVVGKRAWRGEHALSDEILLMRALGTSAFILLTIILCVGPLCRLNPRFLPVLYNRRHLGVMTFLIALAHAGLALGFYHGFSPINPMRSLLTSNTQFGSISAFPFELPGIVALAILFLMASTSHDFWLKNLSPAVWKTLHMMVYPAWGLLVLHIALGALQSERSVLYVLVVIVAVLIVPTLHLISGRREVQRDRDGQAGQWVDAGPVDEIPDQRAKVLCIWGQERVAVFRNGLSVSAIANVCAHQGGPLGEGKIIDGCVTCPWHGYQYRTEDGCAPPPFTEKVATYPVRIENGHVYVRTESIAPGTFIEPARMEELVHV
jgi:methionine sulfoxide reductase heme-binding subunit